MQPISRGKKFSKRDFRSMRGRAEAARRAHNPEVGGSNPPPATKQKRMADGHPFLLVNTCHGTSLSLRCFPILGQAPIEGAFHSHGTMNNAAHDADITSTLALAFEVENPVV